MWVCKSVTQSTSNGNDEDVANLYSLHKQAERKKKMKKKMKLRVSGVVMCAIMAVTSLSVYAGSTSQYFGTSTDSGYATLFAGDAYVYATTRSDFGKAVSTNVRAVGPYGSSSWYPGSSNAYCDAVAACTRGESTHYIGVDSTFLTVSYG